MKNRVCFETIIQKCFGFVCIITFVYLFFQSIILTGKNYKDKEEYIFFTKDSVLINILWLLLSIVVISGIVFLLRKYQKNINMEKKALAASIIAIAVSVYWIITSNTAPQADQENICTHASAFNNGDCSGLQKGGYVSIYRQQLGLITIMRVFFKLFGDGNYHSFQFFSALMSGCIIFFGYQVTKLLSENNFDAELIYLLLGVLFFPMYGYTPFVYGEISSTAVLVFAAWMLLKCIENFSPVCLVLLGLSTGIAVQLRKNSLIVIIGFLIVLAVKIISSRKWNILISMCSIIIGMILLNGIVSGIYSGLVENEGDEMPAALFVAMGTNDELQNAGWWNGYNWYVFTDNDCNVEVSKEIAKATVTSFAAKCKDNPLYAVDFYNRKLTSQWEAPMYQCLAMNSLIDGPQGKIAYVIYDGMGTEIEYFMNIYQLLLYGSVLFLLISKYKKWNTIEKYVLLIGIFGGFLFSAIWEAKTRYVFPYAIMLIPYAAIGISELVTRILAIRKGKYNV